MPTLKSPAPVAEPVRGLSPAVQTRPACPTCGRGPAVVFPRVAAGTGRRPDEAPLVCLDCCPKDGPADRPE